MAKEMGLERLKSVVALACIGGILLPLGTPAFGDGQDTTKKINEKKKVVEEVKDDPIDYLIDKLSWPAMTFAWGALLAANTHRRNLVKKLREEKKAILELPDGKEHRQELWKLWEKLENDLKPLQERLMKDSQNLDELERLRLEKIIDLQGRLREQKVIPEETSLPKALDEFDNWMASPIGLQTQTNRAAWFVDYKQLKSKERALQRTISMNLTHMASETDRVLRRSFDERMHLAPSHTEEMKLASKGAHEFNDSFDPSEAHAHTIDQQRDGLTVNANADSTAWGRLANAYIKSCDDAAVALNDDLSRFRQRRRVQWAGLRAQQGTNTFVRMILGSKGTVAAGLLGFAGSGYMWAKDYIWPPPAPPPPEPTPVHKKLLTSDGMRSIEPFVEVVEDLFKSDKPILRMTPDGELMSVRKAIHASLDGRLSTEERHALDVSTIDLEQRIDLMREATNQDVADIRNAINQGLSDTEQIKDRDVFAGILDLLKNENFSKLSHDEQLARERALRRFLVPFYNKALDVALEGIVKKPSTASERINMAIVEQLVNETIEHLKDKKWLMKPRQTKSAANPAAPAAAKSGVQAIQAPEAPVKAVSAGASPKSSLATPRANANGGIETIAEQ